MDVEHLLEMANQIGAFFRSQGTPEEAVAGIADHLHRFWEPRMRRAIAAHVESGGAGLAPEVAQAVRALAIAQAPSQARPQAQSQASVPSQTRAGPSRPPLARD